MGKTLMLTLMLVISALWMQAQVGIPGRDIWQAPTSTFPTTINGCLRSSGGHYTVTDKDGTIYDLTGSTARLSHDVGHQVEITGKPTVITLDTTMKDIASTAEELPALEVKTARETSNTCNY